MWQILKIYADQDTADRLSDVLLEFGALSVSIEDAHAGTAQEQAIFGEPDMVQNTWHNSLLSALFDPAAELASILGEASHALGLSVIPVHKIETLAEQDWVRLTQLQFDPIQISKRLWIVPSWHTAPDPSAIVLVLDPGLAFGTGSHPTTRLCLQWLDRNLAKTQSVLDYGCGSGILAIAAKKLGAGRAAGVDIDAQAVQAARDNAAQNQVEASFYLPKALPEAQYEVVIANILSNPLKVLAPLLAAYVCPRGHIVLSGILAQQVEEMRAHYGEWFDMRPAIIAEGWACLAGVKAEVKS